MSVCEKVNTHPLTSSLDDSLRMTALLSTANITVLLIRSLPLLSCSTLFSHALASCLCVSICLAALTLCKQRVPSRRQTMCPYLTMIPFLSYSVQKTVSGAILPVGPFYLTAFSSLHCVGFTQTIKRLLIALIHQIANYLSSLRVLCLPVTVFP